MLITKQYQKKKQKWLIYHPTKPYLIVIIYWISARGVVVIVVGNGHGDTSSNPGRD